MRGILVIGRIWNSSAIELHTIALAHEIVKTNKE